MNDKTNDIIMYSPSDLMQILKCGKNQAYSIMKSPGFPSIRFNSKLLVERNELLNWIKSNRGCAVSF